MTPAPESRTELFALAVSSPAVRSILGEPDDPTLAAIERASRSIVLAPDVEQTLYRSGADLVAAQRQEQRYRELAEEARFGSAGAVLHEVAALGHEARAVEAPVARWRWATDPVSRFQSMLGRRLGRFGDAAIIVIIVLVTMVPTLVSLGLTQVSDADPLLVGGAVVYIAVCIAWAFRMDRSETADRRLTGIAQRAEATVRRFLEGPTPDEVHVLERDLEGDGTHQQVVTRRRNAEATFHDLVLAYVLEPAALAVRHPAEPAEPEDRPLEPTADVGPPAGVVVVPDQQPRPRPPAPKRVFVSYARSDLERDPHILNDLKEHCAPFAHRDVFHLWTDGEIEVGDDWKRRIETEVSSCDGAVLLIGPGFLASEFIRDEELPTILDRHLANETRVFPIIVRPCSFATSPLARFQSFNILDQPVSAMDGHQRDTFLLGVAMTIAEAMGN